VDVTASRRVTLMADDDKKTAETAKELTPAARRALAEADERRAAAAREAKERPAEINGPKGEEPTRFGDWERNGIASDF